VALLLGTIGNVVVDGSGGTVTTAHGGDFGGSLTAGSVTNFRNVFARNPSSGAAVTNNTAFYANARTVGTNRYGVYLENVSGGTLNYAIYTNAGLVQFGDAVTIASGGLTATAGDLTMTAGNVLINGDGKYLRSQGLDSGAATITGYFGAEAFAVNGLDLGTSTDHPVRIWREGVKRIEVSERGGNEGLIVLLSEGGSGYTKVAFGNTSTNDWVYLQGPGIGTDNPVLNILFENNVSTPGVGTLRYAFGSDGTAVADVAWNTFSPKPPKAAELMGLRDWLSWAAEDALKPVKPYGGVPSPEHPDVQRLASMRGVTYQEAARQEVANYQKDPAKIAIGTARWAVGVMEMLERARSFEEFRDMVVTA
jgi:hypothetical protein